MEKFISWLSVIFVIALLWGGQVHAAVKCLDAEGEAAIVDGDVPSARAEATARAKWNAVESAVGVEIKAKTLVQDFQLIDDSIIKKTKGMVTSSKVLREEKRNDIYWVNLNACVEPTKATNAVYSMARINSIAVFIPAKKPHLVSEHETSLQSSRGKYDRRQVTIRDEHEEDNIFSSTLIGTLAEAGYTVTDATPTNMVDTVQLESAIRSGNFMSVRSLIYKYLSNMILIGKIDYTISARRGQKFGGNLTMPYNRVTARLTYRLLNRDQSGKIVIVAAGVGEGQGAGVSIEDASSNSLTNLAQEIGPVLVDKITQRIKGVDKKIMVKIDGIREPDELTELKERLQNIAWVQRVEEKSESELIVEYPENTLYLVSSLGRKGNFKVIQWSQTSILLSNN